MKGELGMPEYVDVRDEPRHRHRFENEYARVYDVLVPPGDTTLHHRHTEDTLYVAVESASILDQAMGEDQWNAADVEAGLCICRHHRRRPLIHRVANAGDRDMRMIGVEVKSSPAETKPDFLSGPGWTLKWDKERLRAYSLALEADSRTGVVAGPIAGVLILLTSGCLALATEGTEQLTMSLAVGDVFWLNQESLSIRNAGSTRLDAVLVEWR